MPRPGRFPDIPIAPSFDALFDPPTGIAISIVSPALVFRDLDIKKPRGAQRRPPIAPRPAP